MQDWKALEDIEVISLEKVMMQSGEVQREQHPDAPFVVQTTTPFWVGDAVGAGVGLGVGFPGRYVGADVGGIQAVRVGSGSPYIVSMYRDIEGSHVIHWKGQFAKAWPEMVVTVSGIDRYVNELQLEKAPLSILDTPLDMITDVNDPQLEKE